MPIPYLPSTTAPSITTVDTFWLQDLQGYRASQEKMHHDELLYRLGEYSCFVLMWRIEDFQAGLVGRCARCMTSNVIASQTYKQAPDPKCSDCLGTTFEGGYKAILVRPALWVRTEPEMHPGAHGEVQRATADVQSTSDFAARTDDYVFRADGTRWQIRESVTARLRMGFGYSSGTSDSIGFSYPGTTMEDQSSVAFSIPPTAATIATALNPSFPRKPQTFAGVEVIRGPLF